MCSDSIGICGWLKHSFIDFPGTVSTVLFFAGCNIRCPWCHNPDIVRNLLPPVPLEDVLQYVDKRRNVIDGVVMTGGEPTLHRSLPLIINIFREKSLKIKIDTNGLNPEMVELCQPDYCALDIKTDLASYPRLSCIDHNHEEKMLRSIQFVKNMGTRAEIRITMIPGFIDETTIASLIRVIDGVSKVFLQPFNNKVPLLDERYATVTPIPIEQIHLYRKLIANYVGECHIRGE